MDTDSQTRVCEDCGVLNAGAFTLDLLKRTVTGPAGTARLTPLMAALLAFLMRHSGEPVSRQTIMREVWRTNYLDDTRTLDVHVSWLRRRIEPQPAIPMYLVTRRGVGYVGAIAVARPPVEQLGIHSARPLAIAHGQDAVLRWVAGGNVGVGVKIYLHADARSRVQLGHAA